MGNYVNQLIKDNKDLINSNQIARVIHKCKAFEKATLVRMFQRAKIPFDTPNKENIQKAFRAERIEIYKIEEETHRSPRIVYKVFVKSFPQDLLKFAGAPRIVPALILNRLLDKNIIVDEVLCLKNDPEVNPYDSDNYIVIISFYDYNAR